MLLRALSDTRHTNEGARNEILSPSFGSVAEVTNEADVHETMPSDAAVPSQASRMFDADLLERARREDARHWEEHRRPISADTLRKRLRIGAARSAARIDGPSRSAGAC